MLSMFLVVREEDQEEIDRWVVARIPHLQLLNEGDVYVDNNDNVYSIVRTQTVASVPGSRFTKILFVEAHSCETQGDEEHKKLYLK